MLEKVIRPFSFVSKFAIVRVEYFLLQKAPTKGSIGNCLQFSFKALRANNFFFRNFRWLQEAGGSVFVSLGGILFSQR